MAEENTPSLGGFDIISNMIKGVGPDSDGRTENAIDEPPLIDPLKIKEDLLAKEKERKNASTGKEKEDEEETEEVEVETEDEEESEEKEVETETEDLDLGEFESDVTALLNEKFAEELGWDIPKEDQPKTVAEFVELMQSVIEEESKPRYANDEVKMYDEFVRNGGNLREFYKSAVEGRVDVDHVDLESEFDQKRVLQEHLTNQGYGEGHINKMLKRYDNAGILAEEAAEALELLKDYNDKNKKKLLADQENFAKLREQEQQKFVSTVEDSIKDLDSILGYKLSAKDKEDLRHAILTVDAEGYTPYQRKYMSNVKNLLESAFFTMKGETLGSKIKAQGKSDAVKNLRDKLSANKGNKSRQSGDSGEGRGSSGLSVLSSMLQGS